jgi:hypothetical protein
MKAPDDIRPRLTPEGKFALLLMVAEIVVFAPFALLGQAKLGEGACICFAIVAIALWTTWPLSRKGWHWFAAAFSITIQVPLILYIPWSDRSYRSLMFPIAICDFLAVWGFIKVMWGFIKVIDRLVAKRTG